MKYKVALFDIDGVLNIAEKFSKRYSKKYNIPIEVLIPFFKNEFSKCLIGKADLKQELIKVIPQWKWNGSVDELINFWFEEEIEVNQSVLDAIFRLKEAKIIVVAGTNQEKYRTEFLTKSLNLNDIFYKVYSSCNIGVTKPNKEYYENIIFDLNIKAEEIIYWDDDIDNIEAARELGINGFLFENNTNFINEIERITALTQK